MLRIQNLTKEYTKGVKAVDDLTLTVEPGDIYGFIGHNGAGKTTTIKAVAGIIPFEGGDIFIDGMSILERPVECKSVTAYIPDNPDLYDFMSGAKYLNFIADMFGVPAGERKDIIQKTAADFELQGDLGSLVSSYSHGMKQKLAIISALLHKPKLMILDEPFVGLDPRASFTLKEYIRSLTRDGGAIFFSTHVLEVAEKLCNKIAIIKGGRLIECGPTAEVTGKQSLEDVFLELTNDRSRADA